MTDVYYRTSWGPSGNESEVDCLLVSNDAVAVVVVKSTISIAVFTQITETTMKVAQVFSDKVVLLFVGGPFSVST